MPYGVVEQVALSLCNNSKTFMMSDRDNKQQAGSGGSESRQQQTPAQFNELSELSLEERMNAADHLGEPKSTIEEAVASGTTRGNNDAERIEKENTNKKTEQ